MIGTMGKPVIATNGMVATTHPRAAEIGVEIMQRGGNAVDAAIDTSIAMGLMEPMSCGIGGDLFAIVWNGELHGLSASGRAPLAADIAYFESHKLKEIPVAGPLSWSVPGCVDGWRNLHKKFGSVPW